MRVARARPMSSALLHSLTGQLVRAVEEARMAVPEVGRASDGPGPGWRCWPGRRSWAELDCALVLLQIRVL